MIRTTFFLLVLLTLSSTTLFAQSGSPLFTFGVVSDVQYCDHDITGSRHYRSSLFKLKQAVQYFNEKKVDFIISLGDFIDHDVHSYDSLAVIVSQLQSPVYHVLGNHDFSVEPEEIKRVPAKLGLKKRYYTFKKDIWRFIVLDGNDISIQGSGTDQKKLGEAEAMLKDLKSKKASNAQTYNGGISDKQLNWLKDQLSHAKRKDEKVIVLCHFPVSPDRGRLNLWNYPEVKSLIASYPNVLAYLNGHDHKGGYKQEGSIHYVTFKGMVEKEENAFATVNAYADYLQINGVGAQSSLILK